MNVLDFAPDFRDENDLVARSRNGGHWWLVPVTPYTHHYKDQKTGADKSYVVGSVGDYVAELNVFDEEGVFDAGRSESLGRYRSEMAARIAANRRERRLAKRGNK